QILAVTASGLNCLLTDDDGVFANGGMTLTLLAPSESGGAYHLNNGGKVGGAGFTAAEPNPAPITAQVTGAWTDLHRARLQSSSFANSINDAGLVVGSFLDWHDITGSHAFLWQNQSGIDLNVLIDSSGGWLLQNAWDINERGDIVGDGTLDGFQDHAYLL